MTFDEILNLVSSSQAPDICVDSRKVKAGDVFVAVRGTVYDGHDFIDQALDKGAKYIVCRKDNSSFEIRDSCIELITVDDCAIAAAILAQKSRANPAAKLTNLAVTGTNGKTTVAYLVRSVIQTAGEKCGLIGTIIYDTGSGDACEAALTTPDPLLIAEIQQKMVKAGSKYMVIEASSHALSQNRLAGIRFKAAAFTNLAGDHLDYHKTKEEYLTAKTRLFKSLSENATAVLNRQSPEAEFIAGRTNARLLWYAIDEPADIIAHVETMDMDGTTFVLEYAGQRQNVKTPLLGQHNVSNHLAAAGLCLAAAFDLQITAAGLSTLTTIPGRLEKVDYSARDSSVSSHVFIDYAHTDDALKNVLSTLKPLCKGRLIVLFGCGGDRDRTKRPRMASVAEQLADLVIVKTLWPL
jgi:UDP-N-acetylmuramoyl-L-alanyl-D-glutamate--2,6-diaminopimelate ligase